MRINSPISIFLIALTLISCKSTPKETQEQSFQADLRDATGRFMADFEPRDGMMSLLADAKTGEILASVDLPETGVDRTTTYLYDPGPVFDVFRDSAIMFLPGSLKDSDQAFQFMMNQFGFTDFPLVTAQQIVKAATVFANHGIMGDNEVEVISPEVADKMFASLDREKPADMDEYAVVKHKDVNVISSLSFYPAEDPKYIMYVVVLKPTKLLSSP